jgi:hypothetical protein
MGCYGHSDIGLFVFGLGQETRRRLGHLRTFAVLTSDAMYEIPWNYLHGWNANGKKMVVVVQKQMVVEGKGDLPF